MKHPVRIIFSTLIFSLLILSSCKKEPLFDKSLAGKWEAEYELMEDGSKSFTPPWALLEFEYSDAFILHEDQTLTILWTEKTNNSLKCKWFGSNSNLTIHAGNPDGSSRVFDYKITRISENRIILQTPKGHKWMMKRE